jgi:hypothetical protein
MKKLFVLAMLLSIPAYAEVVNLYWDAPPVGDTAIAYHVYASLIPGTGYEGINSVNAPATTCVVVLPDDGKNHYLIVRAFNGTVESPNSNEIIVLTKLVLPPAAPPRFRKTP